MVILINSKHIKTSIKSQLKNAVFRSNRKALGKMEVIALEPEDFERPGDIENKTGRNRIF